MMMIEDALNHPIPPIPKENCEEKVVTMKIHF